MKWKGTYTPEEELEAAAVLAALLRLHPGAKVRRVNTQPPQRVIYVTTKRRPSPGPSSEKKPWRAVAGAV